jgi:transposase
MARTLRAELGTSQGTVRRVARQLGYGIESVRMSCGCATARRSLM